MKDFLLNLTGADRTVLRGERRHAVKLETLGGILLFTAVLAALSMAFALHMAVRAPWFVAAVLGAGWGLGVLTLDRWLVTSNTRQSNRFLTVLLALPRVALALLLGFVISVPLVLHIFGPEIRPELTVMQQERQAAFDRDLADDPRYADLPQRQAAADGLGRELAAGVTDAQVLDDPAVRDARDQRDRLRAARDAAEEAVTCEKEGRCGSRRAGAGIAYREKVDQLARLTGEVAEAEAELAATTARVRDTLTGRQAEQRTQLAEQRAGIATDLAARDAAVAAYRADSAADDGLLARYEALNRVGDRRPALEHAYWVLKALLIALECLPVIVKLLLSLGRPSTYEQLTLQADEDRVRQEQAERDRVFGEQVRAVAARWDLQEQQLRADLHFQRERLRVEVEAGLELVRHAARRRVEDELERERVARAERLEADYGPDLPEPEVEPPLVDQRTLVLP